MNKTHQIYIPYTIIEKTLQLIKKYGKKFTEGFVLWVASENSDFYKVKDVWEPKQQNSFISYYIPEEEVHKLNVKIYKKKLILIAQIHSHPSYAYHSQTDDDYAIIHLPNLFSIVIPYFGNIDNSEFFEKCAIFQLKKNHWKKISKKKVKKTFKILKEE